MNLFTGLAHDLVALGDRIGDAREMADLPPLVEQLSNDDLVSVLTELAAQKRQLEAVEAVVTGVVAARSTREAGKDGLAQSLGFANPAKFVQHATGVRHGDAVRQVRVAESLYETGPVVVPGAAGDGGADGGDGARGGAAVPGANAAGGTPEAEACARLEPWHQPLKDAFLTGRISGAQQDAIKYGLGEPPVQDDPTWFADVCAGWREAALRLVDSVDQVTVEELGRSARAIRDHLDPAGAEARYLARYEKRSFRMWTDRDGLTRASMLLDDMSAAWVRGVIDSALKPRRGGVRFMTNAERARAEELKADPRTNEQLTHDLIIDVLRAGTLANAEDVHGTRQAGVRVVTVVDSDAASESRAATDGTADINTPDHDHDHDGTARGGSGSADATTPAAVGRAHLEETGAPIPAWEAARETCTGGVVPVTTDRAGNPLDVGRDQRLYTAKQRTGIAIRDGGCMWPACDRPPSYCEAHHIDEWSEGGRTDIDRGISLCRFHHLQLHNGGWRITRERRTGAVRRARTPDGTRASGSPNALGGFTLHPPRRPGTATITGRTGVPVPSEPVVLRRKLAACYQWGELRPPEKRFRGSEQPQPDTAPGAPGRGRRAAA